MSVWVDVSSMPAPYSIDRRAGPCLLLNCYFGCLLRNDVKSGLMSNKVNNATQFSGTQLIVVSFLFSTYLSHTPKSCAPILSVILFQCYTLSTLFATLDCRSI